jgi:hypothetical protein
MESLFALFAAEISPKNFAEACIIHHTTALPLPAIGPFNPALGLEIAQLMSWRHSFLTHLLVPIENPS